MTDSTPLLRAIHIFLNLNRTVTYHPHLTVGRLETKENFRSALEETENLNEEFECLVDAIVVERIEQGGKSIVELKISL